MAAPGSFTLRRRLVPHRPRLGAVAARIPAAENPWASRGLEWQVPTPVPLENFERIPVVNSGPYEYGVEGAPPTATLGPVAVPAAGR